MENIISSLLNIKEQMEHSLQRFDALQQHFKDLQTSRNKMHQIFRQSIDEFEESFSQLEDRICEIEEEDAVAVEEKEAITLDPIIISQVSINAVGDPKTIPSSDCPLLLLSISTISMFPDSDHNQEISKEAVNPAHIRLSHISINHVSHQKSISPFSELPLRLLSSPFLLKIYFPFPFPSYLSVVSSNKHSLTVRRECLAIRWKFDPGGVKFQFLGSSPSPQKSQLTDLPQFNVFKANLRRARRHQSRDPSTTHGVTQISDLTPYEFRRDFLGLRSRLRLLSIAEAQKALEVSHLILGKRDTTSFLWEVNFRDVQKLYEILFKELDGRFKQFFSDLYDVKSDTCKEMDGNADGYSDDQKRGAPLRGSNSSQRKTRKNWDFPSSNLAWPIISCRWDHQFQLLREQTAHGVPTTLFKAWVSASEHKFQFNEDEVISEKDPNNIVHVPVENLRDFVNKSLENWDSEIYSRKYEENAKTISLFMDVIHLSDAIDDEGKRLENLLRGIFEGNIFDLGSAQLAEVFAKDGMPFLASYQNLVPRPWVIDDLDIFKLKWSKKPWKKAIIFVDNSGADIVLGIFPFVTELLRQGTQVVLAAKDLPSINDVTYPELVEIISKLKGKHGQLLVVVSYGGGKIFISLQALGDTKIAHQLLDVLPLRVVFKPFDRGKERSPLEMNSEGRNTNELLPPEEFEHLDVPVCEEFTSPMNKTLYISENDFGAWMRIGFSSQKIA